MTDDEKAIVADHIEKLCSAVRRSSALNREMLGIALIALDEGKSHVVQDHIERVLGYLDGLERSLAPSPNLYNPL